MMTHNLWGNAEQITIYYFPKTAPVFWYLLQVKNGPHFDTILPFAKFESDFFKNIISNINCGRGVNHKVHRLDYNWAFS